jgi:hypothetical protein
MRPTVPSPRLGLRNSSTARGGVPYGLPLVTFCLLVAACGGAKHAASPPATTAPPATTNAATTTNGQSPNALQGEAGSAATGDIPDNQVFVTFRDVPAGYSVKYPEGWARNGTGTRVAFRDKNNVVRIVVQAGTPETVGGVRAEMAALRRATPSLQFRAPARVSIGRAPAIEIVYGTESSPNPVTNKRVKLTVNRFYLWHAGKRAVIDLGTPVGVDNVDAYRLMIQSFRWR